jgi:hypothetical protein
VFDAARTGSARPKKGIVRTQTTKCHPAVSGAPGRGVPLPPFSHHTGTCVRPLCVRSELRTERGGDSDALVLVAAENQKDGRFEYGSLLDSADLPNSLVARGRVPPRREGRGYCRLPHRPKSRAWRPERPLSFPFPAPYGVERDRTHPCDTAGGQTRYAGLIGGQADEGRPMFLTGIPGSSARRAFRSRRRSQLSWELSATTVGPRRARQASSSRVRSR